MVSYPKYKRPNISETKTGPIQVYGVNSYRGLIKKYNEDRVSIILNITKPERPDWPKQLSIFDYMTDIQEANAVISLETTFIFISLKVSYSQEISKELSTMPSHY